MTQENKSAGPGQPGQHGDRDADSHEQSRQFRREAAAKQGPKPTTRPEPGNDMPVDHDAVDRKPGN